MKKLQKLFLKKFCKDTPSMKAYCSKLDIKQNKVLQLLSQVKIIQIRKKLGKVVEN